MLVVDNIEWSIPCDITRVSEIKLSEISGLLLNRTQFNDVIGTYLKYTIKLVPNPQSMEDYYELYEALTAPTGEHEFVLPYNGETVTMSGRVDSITDIYIEMPNRQRYWRGIQFTVTGNEPYKAEELEDVLGEQEAET